MIMQADVKESTIVKPAHDTPKKRLWLSNQDLLHVKLHMRTVHFYKHHGSATATAAADGNFFDSAVVKEALSKVLVPFYPVAGRLTRDPSGRLEIDCNAEGVLFVEAEAGCRMADLLSDSAENSELGWLVPSVDYSTPISSYPLLLTQLTRFKCGSVCVGIGLFHTVADGIAAVNFINSWADNARGFPVHRDPFLDRTVLRPRSPPSLAFHHAEYDPAPTMNAGTQTQDLSLNQLNANSTASLKITSDYLATLKAMVSNTETKTNYTSYEALVAHIWRAVTKARGLAGDQATRFHIAVDGRARLRPPVPENYFGNMIFHARPVVLAGDLQTEPFISTVERIHSSIKRMDNEYLRSAIDFLEIQSDVDALGPTKGKEFYQSPNLSIVSWSRMPMTETNFGWGVPEYVRPASIYSEGKGYILSSPENDGSLSLVICLETQFIQPFKKLFYDLN